MTLDFNPNEQVTLAIDDVECGTLRIGRGWVCQMLDVPHIPPIITAMVKHIERQRGKPVEE